MYSTSTPCSSLNEIFSHVLTLSSHFKRLRGSPSGTLHRAPLGSLPRSRPPRPLPARRSVAHSLSLCSLYYSNGAGEIHSQHANGTDTARSFAAQKSRNGLPIPRASCLAASCIVCGAQRRTAHATLLVALASNSSTAGACRGSSTCLASSEAVCSPPARSPRRLLRRRR